MHDLIKTWDGEHVVVRYDRESGAWIFVAVHSTRLGPATGGTRMKHYSKPREGLRDALLLSEAMTLKYAVPRFPRGGGKAVIALPDDFDRTGRDKLLLRYGDLVRSLRGAFQTGPDVGTSPKDMDIIAETGAPYIFCRTPDRGGAGDSAPATAFGLFCGMEAVCEATFGSGSLAGRRVLVQGAGSVGGRLIDLLLDAGADVLFSDVNPETVMRFRDGRGVPFIQPDDLFNTECDILAPCALGGVLDGKTIPRLRCRAIAGAANNQLAERADAERLRQRGILYAPDYVVSVGGAMAITGIEAMGWTKEEAAERLRGVADTVREVFALADAEGIDTDSAARKIAERNLG